MQFWPKRNWDQKEKGKKVAGEGEEQGMGIGDGREGAINTWSITSVHTDIVVLYSRSKLPWEWSRLLIISMLGKLETEESVYRNQQHGIIYTDNKSVTFSEKDFALKWNTSTIIPWFKKVIQIYTTWILLKRAN